MNKKEITGAENVFRALLDGYTLTSPGDVKMQIKSGLLMIRNRERVFNMDIEDTPFTYTFSELKDGGKYTTRSGECVLLAAAPKRHGAPWAGIVFHEDSIEAVFYLKDGKRLHSCGSHPLDIVDVWNE